MSACQLEYSLGVHGRRDRDDPRRGAESEEGARNLRAAELNQISLIFGSSRHRLSSGAATPTTEPREFWMWLDTFLDGDESLDRETIKIHIRRVTHLTETFIIEEHSSTHTQIHIERYFILFATKKYIFKERWQECESTRGLCVTHGDAITNIYFRM